MSNFIKQLYKVATYKSFQSYPFQVQCYSTTQPTDKKEKILSDLEYMICRYFLDEILLEDLTAVLYSLKNSKFKFKAKIKIHDILETEFYSINLLIGLSSNKEKMQINITYSNKSISDYSIKSIDFSAVLEQINSIINLYELI